MTDENVDVKCTCGRPATVPARYGSPKCMVCHLVASYGTPPPRSAPGNIGDWEIQSWMRRQLQEAIKEMVSLMRADLDALAKTWNPPPQDDNEVT